uniref:CRAL-TRIO domain-containing protein n=1 Tax=Meloidogyne floridensis TaxID=298350 RepID=A0A915P7T7_9BILA
MLFVSSGTLSYYSQLLHYDNYPDLVYPIEMVNIAKWIYIPYRLIKSMMPVGFVDRFRLHDANFLENLCMEINLDYIPHSLGGQNQARKFLSLIWYFRTDGIIQFGVFFEPLRNERKENKQNGKYLNGNHNGIITPTPGTRPSIEYFEKNMEWVYMWFKLTAKIHHEWDSVECTQPGIYWIIFSNCHSWIHKRYVEVIIQLTSEDNEQTNIKRIWHDKREEENNNLENYEDLRKIFQMKIKT